MWWRRLKWRLWSSTSFFRRCWRWTKENIRNALIGGSKLSIETLHLVRAIIPMKRPLSIVAGQVMEIDCDTADNSLRTFSFAWAEVVENENSQSGEYARRMLSSRSTDDTCKQLLISIIADVIRQRRSRCFELFSRADKPCRAGLCSLLGFYLPDCAFVWNSPLGDNPHLLVMQLAVIAKLECDDTEWMSESISQNGYGNESNVNLAKESNESRKKLSAFQRTPRELKLL